MNRNKKIVAAVGAAAAAAIAVVSGSLALFTDNAEKAERGIAGNVDIYASDLKLSNPDNINPGDNDPDLPDKYEPKPGDPMYDKRDENGEVDIVTTGHNLTFTIANNGNKSIRTRQTLVLSVKNGDKYLDARRLQLYEVADDEKTSAEKELATGTENTFDGDNGKTYIAEDGTEYTDAASIPEGVLIKSIRYRVTPDIFDGVGLQAELEEESTVKGDGQTAVTKDYMYKLALDMETPNEYQGADINIEMMVEALQFRNTTHSDWKLVSTNSFDASIAGSSVGAVQNRSDN